LAAQEYIPAAIPENAAAAGLREDEFAAHTQHLLALAEVNHRLRLLK
jgi:hypothetical protein